jgi:radical SAM superfamily enzyme YgiQ (UPF0313 family)
MASPTNFVYSGVGPCTERIAAFMKALLVNPETPPSYWSFKETCELAGCKALCPPLGLITVAALLPEEWQLRVVDLETRVLTDDDWLWADLVMISAMVVQKDGAHRVIRQAKERGKPVVIGGTYPSSLPDELIEAGCDFVVTGEGEITVPLLLRALKEGKSGGLIESYEKPDMVTSPVPRYDLLNLDDYVILSLQTSRGCPFNCEFCDIISLFGRNPRYKEPEQVIKELENLRNLGWRKDVFISDDNFIGHKPHAKAILAKLTPWLENNGKPFSFWTQASVNLGQDLDLIDHLTEANFSTIFVGVESPDEDVLKLNRKYQNIKNPLVESLNNICKNGLVVVASFIIGFDGEERGTGDRISSFVELTSVPLVMLNTLQVAPNTALGDRLAKEGRRMDHKTTGQSTGARLNYLPTRPETEILAEYLEAWEYLYDPARYLDRAYRYFLTMRPTRLAMGMKDGPTVPVKQAPRRYSLSMRLGNFVRFLRLSWRLGIRPKYRWQYWRQLLGIWKRNPSRLVTYLNFCSLGENMFGLAPTIRKSVTTAIEDAATESQAVDGERMVVRKSQGSGK